MTFGCPTHHVLCVTVTWDWDALAARPGGQLGSHLLSMSWSQHPHRQPCTWVPALSLHRGATPPAGGGAQRALGQAWLFPDRQHLPSQMAAVRSPWWLSPEPQGPGRPLTAQHAPLCSSTGRKRWAASAVGQPSFLHAPESRQGPGARPWPQLAGSRARAVGRRMSRPAKGNDRSASAGCSKEVLLLAHGRSLSLPAMRRCHPPFLRRASQSRMHEAATMGVDLSVALWPQPLQGFRLDHVRTKTPKRSHLGLSWKEEMPSTHWEWCCGLSSPGPC